MQRLRTKGSCLFPAMPKLPSAVDRALVMTGKRHSKVTRMIRDIPQHSNKEALTNTPLPGTYHIRDFIEETGLNPVRMTYGFKNTGRSKTIMCMKSGTMLLPVHQNRASYSFKSCPRPDNYTLSIRDKDINLSPCHYDVTEKTVPKSPCKYKNIFSMQRLLFLPRTPGPGTYEASWQIMPLPPRTK
ncbi:hypothetical protein HF521_009530 [Silurus meridionalis]|uniref:Uncharacterized protein n=1 Tax=Silurus meridionalis TaxID=175797 RepID=A0A8T0BUE4_SILME|nr:hypothetical protein HF521_009530 [Silurus meridionalis]